MPTRRVAAARGHAILGKTREVTVTIDSYKTILYSQEDGSWVAEIPAIVVTP